GVAGARYLIDSSKEVTRGLFLARHLPHTRIIHLVRNPEGIIASNLHRVRTGVGFKFLRHTFKNPALTPVYLALSSLGWMVGNVLAEIVKMIARGRVLRIRYEDLCGDAPTELRRIAAFTGIDLADVVQGVSRGNEFPMGHQIGG